MTNKLVIDKRIISPDDQEIVKNAVTIFMLVFLNSF